MNRSLVLAAATALLVSGCSFDQGEPLQADELLVEAHAFETGFDGYEPSIGVDAQGRVFVGGAGKFPGLVVPGAFDLDAVRSTAVVRSLDGSSWQQVNDFPATFDPILHVDGESQRVYRAHMISTQCTSLAWSADGGDTWVERPGACGGRGVDFIKLGSGPPGPSANPLAEGADHVLYLCHNRNTDTASTTVCGMSYDGGLTWPDEALVADRERDGCAGVTSFPIVGPSGRAVVPLGGGCSTLHLGVSDDSGVSWRVERLPYDGGEATVTPRAAFDGDTLYVLWADFTGRVWLAWSSDLVDWRRQDVTPTGVATISHAGMDVVAPGRVAFAFLGTDTLVQSSEAPEGTEWHLHAGVWEGGATGHVVVDAEPVQVGRICYGGGGCARNLGDFFDAAAAPDGALWMAYVDGCDGCTSGQSDGTALKVARIVASA